MRRASCRCASARVTQPRLHGHTHHKRPLNPPPSQLQYDTTRTHTTRHLRPLTPPPSITQLDKTTHGNAHHRGLVRSTRRAPRSVVLFQDPDSELDSCFPLQTAVLKVARSTKTNDATVSLLRITWCHVLWASRVTSRPVDVLRAWHVTSSHVFRRSRKTRHVLCTSRTCSRSVPRSGNEAEQ